MQFFHRLKIFSRIFEGSHFCFSGKVRCAVGIAGSSTYVQRYYPKTLAGIAEKNNFLIQKCSKNLFIFLSRRFSVVFWLITVVVMPRVNLARLKAGALPRDGAVSQSRCQARISTFFSTKKSDGDDVGAEGEPLSRKVCYPLTVLKSVGGKCPTGGTYLDVSNPLLSPHVAMRVRWGEGGGGAEKLDE